MTTSGGPPGVEPVIRRARPGEAAALENIERAAGDLFRDLGMDAIADDDPGPVELLEHWIADGYTIVATDPVDRPIGYLLMAELDGEGHIHQVSVEPHWSHRGVGRRLIDHAGRWAMQQGWGGVSLTTFAEVPWNAPYYQRLGFVTVPPELLPPGLRTIRAEESARGLDAWPRVVMRRDVSRPVGANPDSKGPWFSWDIPAVRS